MTIFTHQEEEKFLSAVKKIKKPQQGLPEAVFESLCKIVPFVACEIIIQDKNGRFLLTWREDKWWKGWHFPGGLMRVGETFAHRINQTTLRELGVKTRRIKFLKTIDQKRDKRGYVISLVFLCTLDKTPKTGKFFSKIPKDIIPEHRLMWKDVAKIIK